jgi:hypothetical protein
MSIGENFPALQALQALQARAVPTDSPFWLRPSKSRPASGSSTTKPATVPLRGASHQKVTPKTGSPQACMNWMRCHPERVQ